MCVYNYLGPGGFGYEAKDEAEDAGENGEDDEKSPRFAAEVGAPASGSEIGVSYCHCFRH